MKDVFKNKIEYNKETIHARGGMWQNIVCTALNEILNKNWVKKTRKKKQEREFKLIEFI